MDWIFCPEKTYFSTYYHAPYQMSTATLHAEKSFVECPDVVDIISAEYQGGYVLNLSFSDGFSRTLDFESFLRTAQNPMTTKYRNVDLFRHFEIVHGSLTWNDNEMCFPIADLYEGNI